LSRGSRTDEDDFEVTDEREVRLCRAESRAVRCSCAKDAVNVYLEAFITEGQPTIAQLDEKGPKPPLYIPGWGDRISEGELADLISYLQSLKPE
jgi:hypothetical protein